MLVESTRCNPIIDAGISEYDSASNTLYILVETTRSIMPYKVSPIFRFEYPRIASLFRKSPKAGLKELVKMDVKIIPLSTRSNPKGYSRINPMSTYYTNPYTRAQEIVDAWLQGIPRRIAPPPYMAVSPGFYQYRTDGITLWVWDNIVAKKVEDGIYLTDSGWILLTQRILNVILSKLGTGLRIRQRRRRWYIDGEEWPGYIYLRFNVKMRPQPKMLVR